MRTRTPLVTAIAALALAGCGTAASTSAPRPPPSQAASTSAPPTQTDPNGLACVQMDPAGYCPGDDPVTTAPPAAPTESAAQVALDNWCAGNGYSDLTTVESDMTQLSTDAGNNDLIAVEQDGTQLFGDASTAGQNLPPRSDPHAFGYGIYMGYLLIAGSRASNGNLSGAGSSSAAMQTASQHLPDVQAINTSCGGTS
jgi:hypothetical protein